MGELDGSTDIGSSTTGAGGKLGAPCGGAKLLDAAVLLEAAGWTCELGPASE